MPRLQADRRCGGRGVEAWRSCDPHPIPPHKGEGTGSAWDACGDPKLRYGTIGSPPPCGEEMEVGVSSHHPANSHRKTSYPRPLNLHHHCPIPPLRHVVTSKRRPGMARGRQLRLSVIPGFWEVGKPGSPGFTRGYSDSCRLRSVTWIALVKNPIVWGKGRFAPNHIPTLRPTLPQTAAPQPRPKILRGEKLLPIAGRACDTGGWKRRSVCRGACHPEG
jgi:hypothetical protein